MDEPGGDQGGPRVRLWGMKCLLGFTVNQIHVYLGYLEGIRKKKKNDLRL